MNATSLETVEPSNIWLFGLQASAITGLGSANERYLSERIADNPCIELLCDTELLSLREKILSKRFPGSSRGQPDFFGSYTSFLHHDRGVAQYGTPTRVA
jgi:hypothetical protein